MGFPVHLVEGQLLAERRLPLQQLWLHRVGAAGLVPVPKLWLPGVLDLSESLPCQYGF